MTTICSPSNFTSDQENVSILSLPRLSSLSNAYELLDSPRISQHEPNTNNTSKCLYFVVV
jgi:hypothetical protein